jgi:hypothetical protein
MLYLIIAQVAVFAFDYLFAFRGMNLSQWLYFDRSLILQGQVWRVISFVAVPDQSNPFFMLLFMYVYYSLAREIESNWGGFFFNLFYLFGVIGTIIGGFITGYASIVYINLSIFLAYAALFPHAVFLLFFIIPVKAKWLAIIYLIFLGISLILGDFATKIAILFSMGNIILFFWNDYYPKIRDKFRYRKIRETYKREMRR